MDDKNLIIDRLHVLGIAYATSALRACVKIIRCIEGRTYVPCPLCLNFDCETFSEASNPCPWLVFHSELSPQDGSPCENWLRKQAGKDAPPVGFGGMRSQKDSYRYVDDARDLAETPGCRSYDSLTAQRLADLYRWTEVIEEAFPSLRHRKG